jgi:hypothetical protein
MLRQRIALAVKPAVVELPVYRPRRSVIIQR